MTRTLVIHIGGIGDFLLSCPALPGLRRDGPVELLGRRERLQVAVDGGLADAAHEADSVDMGTMFGTPSPRLRSFLARFDRCVAWIGPGDGIPGSIRECGVSDVRAYAGLPPADWARHASEYYLECLNLDDPGPPRLALPDEDGKRGLDVVIQPGSGGAYKNWPLENFRAVNEELSRRGRRVVWCTGPAEEEMPRLEPSLPPMRLPELARALARARLYIGNDSGITHLAAASGCRTVAVFGPTDPAVWAPRGKNVGVAGGGGGFPKAGDVLAALADW